MLLIGLQTRQPESVAQAYGANGPLVIVDRLQNAQTNRRHRARISISFRLWHWQIAVSIFFSRRFAMSGLMISSCNHYSCKRRASKNLRAPCGGYIRVNTLYSPSPITRIIRPRCFAVDALRCSAPPGSSRAFGRVRTAGRDILASRPGKSFPFYHPFPL